MSAPTQKAFGPAPVRITARKSVNASSSAVTASMRSSMAGVKALSFSGRFSVTTAIAPRRSTWIPSISATMSLLELQSERRFAENRGIHGFQIR